MQKENKKGLSLKDAFKANKWRVIPIERLPKGSPVLAVQEFASKSLAKFHLVERVIVPIFEESPLPAKVNRDETNKWTIYIDEHKEESILSVFKNGEKEVLGESHKDFSSAIQSLLQPSTKSKGSDTV